jgi:hypothetical protein
MNDFSKIPTRWMKDSWDDDHNSLLNNFRWNGKEKSNYIAALMIYICIAQQIQKEKGETSISYSELSKLTSLSRSKVSSGVSILKEKEIIYVSYGKKTNSYSLVWRENEKGWAKLPVRKMYNKDCSAIEPFKYFFLRKKVELDALKLYLILIAFRRNEENSTVIKYETINYYTGIAINDIKSASSFLVSLKMINVDKSSTDDYEEKKWRNVYRINGIDRYKHAGNSPNLS